MALFPQEVMTEVPCITVTGSSSVRIEQHKGLVGYREEEVIFRTACGLLHITGNGLRFKLYAVNEAIVVGEISGVLLGGGERK